MISVTVSGRRADQQFNRSDWVADEVPIALEFNGVAHAVMLATPLDLEDFALGFALSEGILEKASQLYGTEIKKQSNGITVQMKIASSAFENLKGRRRTMAGRTGCGLCGTESLAQVSRPLIALPEPKTSPIKFSANQICNAMKALQECQPLQRATGAVHAAAWCNANGQLMIVREDVGRHNALDKVSGALARNQNLQANQGFFVVTSRASFEMVQKTVMARVPLLAAVSAATALAIQIANESNLSLVGFVRDNDLLIYSHEVRVQI